jgi:hypothetical protein
MIVNFLHGSFVSCVRGRCICTESHVLPAGYLVCVLYSSNETVSYSLTRLVDVSRLCNEGSFIPV